MRVQIAQVISYLFHPLALPIYALFLFSVSDPYFKLFLPADLKLKALFMFIGLTFVGPLALLSVYRRIGTIDNFSDPNKSSRILVAVVILTFYFITYYLFQKLHLSQVYYTLFLSIIIAICIATLISFFYKISMHGLAVGGILGAQFSLFLLHNTYNMYILIGLIAICGLVGSSRLIIKAHTIDQVYSGILLGILTVGSFILLRS